MKQNTMKLLVRISHGRFIITFNFTGPQEVRIITNIPALSKIHGSYTPTYLLNNGIQFRLSIG